MLDSVVKNPPVLQISLILIVMRVVVRVNSRVFREFGTDQSNSSRCLSQSM